jgi:hypothetical protein
MSNFAQVNIIFTGFSDLNAQIQIKFRKGGITVYTRTWFCKASRTGSYEYTQGNSASDQYLKFLQAAYADILVDSDLQNWTVSPGLAQNTIAFQADEYGWEPLSTAFSSSPRAYSTFIYEKLPNLYVYAEFIGWNKVDDEIPFGFNTTLNVFNGTWQTVKKGDYVYNGAQWLIIG